MKYPEKTSITTTQTKIDDPSGKLTQRAYLTAVASLLDYATKVTMTLVVTPILLKGLGDVLFGVWQILNRIVSYMSAADGRPTQALKWIIAQEQLENNDANKRRYIGSAIAVWLLFSPLLLFVGTFIVWISPKFTGTPTNLNFVVRITTGILVFNFLLAGISSIPASVMRGMNLAYKQMGIVASFNIIGGIFTVTSLHFGMGLWGVALAQVILTIITGLVYWRITKMYLPWFGIDRPSWTEIKAFSSKSIWYSAWTIIDRLLLASDVIVLGYFASGEDVTIYTLMAYPSSLVISVIILLVGASIPGLGGIIGQKQSVKAAALRTEIMTLSWLLVTLVGSLILLWNQSFISLWVGEEYFAGQWVNILLVLIMVQLIFIKNDAFVIDVTLDLRNKVVIGGLSAVFSIGIAYLLIPQFGIIGLCLGILLGRTLLTISYPILVRRFLEIHIDKNKLLWVRPITITIILFFLSSSFGERILISSWLIFILYGCISAGIILFFGFFGGLNPIKRIQLYNRVRSITLFSRL